MIDNVPQSLPLPETHPEISPPAPEIVSPQTKKDNKKLIIVGGIGLGVLCLCVIAGAALLGVGLFKVAQEKAPIASVLDSFMKYMVAKDVDSAYALFSPRVQRQVPISKMEGMIEGPNYVLFDGYQYITMGNLNISAVANTNQDVPQGTVATVNGTILYIGGIQGTFTGTLEKVDGEWKIFSVNVTVPPSKVHP